ncbi:MAG: dipeptidase [Clostridium perfringens]|nr:dipeptidase [Clostridium perfringens]
MKFIDFHCDTAYILFKNKGKTLKDNDLKVNVEKLKRGKALGQFFALFIDDKENNDSFRTCLSMLNNLKSELNKSNGDIKICRGYNDYKDNKVSGKISAFLTIEGGEAIKDNLDSINFFKAQGVSLITLTWNYENNIGYPNYKYTYKDRGLKKFGLEAIERMNDLGIIIDVSHLSDGGFYDVLKYSKKPFVASHSNSRFITNHSRNLTDDMIKKLSNKGGVLGINFCSSFLGESKIAKVDDMVKHIRYIRNIGGVECISLGTDFDGIENEVEIKDSSEMEKLYYSLEKERFTMDEIEKIFYKNTERIIKDIL